MHRILNGEAALPSKITHMVLFGDIGKPKQIMAASGYPRRAGTIGEVPQK